MTSFQINISGNTLKLKFEEPASGDEIVRDAASRMKQLIDSEELKGGPLLLVDGPCTLAAAYTIAHGVSHLFGAIAVYDPKVGKMGTIDGALYPYIITACPDKDSGVGGVLCRVGVEGNCQNCQRLWGFQGRDRYFISGIDRQGSPSRTRGRCFPASHGGGVGEVVDP